MSKYNWSDNDINILNNQALDCHNCIFKFNDVTAFCGKYLENKPKFVFDGGKCPSKQVKNG